MFEQIRKSLKGRASVLRWLQVAAVASLFIQGGLGATGSWLQHHRPKPDHGSVPQPADPVDHERLGLCEYALRDSGRHRVRVERGRHAARKERPPELDVCADPKADVDRRVLRVAAERPNLDSRDHRQLYADWPKRSRARRAIPERRVHPGLSASPERCWMAQAHPRSSRTPAHRWRWRLRLC